MNMDLYKIAGEFGKILKEAEAEEKICEDCGEPMPCECKVAEEETPEIEDMSGKVEDIIINPELDIYRSSSNQQTMEWWRKALPVAPSKLMEWADVDHMKDLDAAALKRAIEGRTKRLGEYKKTLGQHTDPDNQEMIKNDIEELQTGIAKLKGFLASKKD